MGGMRLLTLVLGVVVVVGCGGDGEGEVDAVPPAPPDAMVAAACGDGVLDPGEACDGDARGCADLGGSWSSGDAPCRADCLGWDPAACGRAGAGAFEAVKPAERDPRWETARCNDGTPFAFVVRLAPAPTDEWVIYLQGGVMCDDDAFSCAAREAYLTTTLPFADRSLGPIPFGGLFSSNATVNPFSAANQVLAHYCSSDFWSGATTDLRPTSAGDWIMSGRANVASMLEILGERYGLGDEDHVLFGGGSAGAFGAHFNVGQVEAMFPGASLYLFVDAGVMHAWDDPAYTIGDSTLPDLDVWRNARTFWGGTFDPECEAAFVDPVQCLFGATWYPFVSARVPTFVQQSTLDASFIGVHGIGPSQPIADVWQAEAEAELAGMSWLFTSAISYHVLGTSDDGLAVGPIGDSLGAALRRFFDGGAPERIAF